MIRTGRVGSHPLISAAEAGNEAMAKALLEAGANPDHDADNYTPLMSAIRPRKMAIFIILAERVSDPDHADKRDRTPLMHAMAEQLLERGARSNAEGEDSEILLSIAAQRGATGQLALRENSWSRACKCRGSRLTPLCCRERPSRWG